MDANPKSASSTEDCPSELADLICEAIKNLECRPLILGILADYKITRKTKAIIQYNGGETDYLIKRFLISRKVKGCTDQTCRLYKQNLYKSFGTIGKSPTQCDHTDIQALLAKLIINGTSKAYQQNVQRTLSSFYAWLYREEITTKNIMMKVDPIQAKPKHKKAFTDMDVEKIRMACKTNRERALVEILLSTGCRVFEVAKLRRDEITSESFQIVGKGDKERTVYLNAKATIAIQQYLQERKDDNPWLFPASINVGRNATKAPALKGMGDWYKYPEQVSIDSHNDNSTIESIIRTIGRRAGVDNCHPHRFRRTCATMALRRGMNVVLVQQMLGHESLATTQRYLDIATEELQEAHRRFVV